MNDATLLDNAFWHALIGPQTALAVRSGGAARYVPEVAPFAAVARYGEGWDDLRALCRPGEGFALLSSAPPAVPDDFSLVNVVPVVQMVLDELRPAGGAAVVPLGPDDADEMIALVRLTRPGPFRPRTVELGGYVGVRDAEGRLVAMAGERARPPGFAEVSAVCVHPEARGRGYAAAVCTRVVSGILERGERPFLHVSPDNAGARRLYAGLGFAERAELCVAGLRRRPN